MAERKKRERKRRIKFVITCVSVLLVLIAAGVILAALYAPQYLQRFSDSKPLVASANGGEHQPLAYNGLDVSYKQRLVDWQRVAYDTNIKFAYAKATEGATIVDKQYAHNSEGATAANIPFGSYHYLTSRCSAREQFDNFSSTATRVAQVLKPMVKVETDGVQGWSKEQIQSNLAEMLKLIQDFYRCQPIICCSAAFYNEYLAGRFDRYQLFLTQYNENEPVVAGAGGNDVWQLPDQGFVKGINTAVNLDVFADGTTLSDLLISDIVEH